MQPSTGMWTCGNGLQAATINKRVMQYVGASAYSWLELSMLATEV